MTRMGNAAAHTLSFLLVAGVVMMVFAACAVAAVCFVLAQVDPAILALLPSGDDGAFTAAAFGTVGGRVALWIVLSQSLIVGIVVAIALRQMLRSAMRGAPFVASNVTRLRVIAAAYGIGVATRFLVPPLAPPAVATWLTRHGWAYEIGGLAPLLVALVLSEVFREGIRLREDTELAI